MADIIIQDTGMRSIGDLVAQETDKANSGNDIELKSVEITMEQKKLMNADPAVGKTVDNDDAKMYTWVDIDLTGIDRRKWMVRGVLNSSLLADLQTFSQLCSLARTKGYKKLKPFSGNPAHAGGGIIAYASESGAPLAHVNVRVAGITATVLSNESKIDYELELVEDQED